MRSVIAKIPSRTYPAGSRLRLFGLDAMGVFDDGTPVPSGQTPLQPSQSSPSPWLEAGWLSTPWLGEQRFAGWCETTWLGQAWLAETVEVYIIGDLHEYGVVQYGVQVIDDRDNAGSAPTAIDVFVNSEPQPSARQSISVAAGVVTLTLTPYPN